MKETSKDFGQFFDANEVKVSVNCSKEDCNTISLPNTHYCLSCWYDQRVKNLGMGRDTRGKELEQIAINQNYKCPYSGEDLVPAVNMTVDHIVPIAKDRTKKRDITNLQWTTPLMNHMKADSSHDEFLAICRKIVEVDNAKKRGQILWVKRMWEKLLDFLNF